MIIEVKTLEPLSSIDVDLNLEDYVQASSDLISLSPCLVKGRIKKDFETVTLRLNIQVDVVQKCALTLKPVAYDLAFETEVIFSKNIDILDYYLEDVIDLNQLVFAEILLEKEPFVYHESADHSLFEEKKEGHPVFKGLKK